MFRGGSGRLCNRSPLITLGGGFSSPLADLFPHKFFSFIFSKIPEFESCLTDLKKKLNDDPKLSLGSRYLADGLLSSLAADVLLTDRFKSSKFLLKSIVNILKVKVIIDLLVSTITQIITPLKIITIQL